MLENVTHYKYRVQGRGVFGRNRSIKFESWNLARVPVSERKSAEAVIALAREALAEAKVKPGFQYRVCEDPIEVRNEFGFETEKFELMSENTLAEGVVGQPGAIL